jgi:hypothetical protein
MGGRNDNPAASTHTVSTVVFLKRRANKGMATERGVYSTISIIHNGYYLKKLTKLQTAPSSPWSIYSNAESSIT